MSRVRFEDDDAGAVQGVDEETPILATKSTVNDPSKMAGGEDTADGLAVQDLSRLDPASLTALSHEVISRQATINIGTVGHVAHGKSTVVKAISGVQTV